eukprot:gene4718-8302_t
MKYLLPDNEEILLGEELYESTEILFQPELFGFEEYGVVDMIDKCIKASPIDTRNENKSVLDTFHILEQQGFEVDYLQKNGQELLGELHSKLKTNTSLVSVAFCNPKNGVIQPISEISKICQKNETLFHTDASKIIGKIPMNVDDLHVNLLSFSSKEIIQNEDFDIIYTGNDFPFKFSQNEFSKEEKSSLQDFAEAIEFLQLNMMNDIEIMKNLSMKLFTKLKEELRFIEIVCESEKRNPGILNVNFKYVGNGLKKSEYAFVPSRVVKSKNRNVLCASTGTTEIVDESLTFNFNRFATEKEIDSIAKTVIKEVQNIREKSSMYKLFCKMNPE